MSIRVEVWGNYACFSRPELKTERVSYDMITPSAARGLLEAIYWHPGLNWVIDKIYILEPICIKRQSTENTSEIHLTSIKRNEVKSKVLASNVKSAMTGSGVSLYLNTASERNQRSSLILQDVHYVLEAHFDMTGHAEPEDNPGKFQDIMKRRLKKGQCYHQPYFGCREFLAHFQESFCRTEKPFTKATNLFIITTLKTRESLKLSANRTATQPPKIRRKHSPE